MADVLGFSVTTTGGAFGAVVEGLSWEEPNSEVVAALNCAFRRHLLLCFRGQPSPSKEELTNFFRPFGRIMSETREGQAHYAVFTDDRAKLAQYREGGTNYIDAAGSGTELRWHTDHYHKSQLKKLGGLEAIDCEESAPPTLFRDMYTAYEVLDWETRARLAYKLGVYFDPRKPSVDEVPRLSDATHALFTAHPDSGRLCLYVSEDTDRIVGLDDDESDRYLRLLREHAAGTAPVYAHHWLDGDFVVWDNVGLQHKRDAVDASMRRRLRVFEGVAE
jgi:alpha-ketoglutarate-dependent taurine dioxygenase